MCHSNRRTIPTWADLQQDLLTLIAQRLDLLQDFSSFSRVCRSWRSVAVKENFKGFQQLPWLMLPEGDQDEEEANPEQTNNTVLPGYRVRNRSDYRRFVSSTEGNAIGKLMLPEAKGKWYFESLGWLITLSKTGDMSLLHPFTRVQIPLPHISTFKNSNNNLIFLRKAVLSSCPSVSNDNYVLMVLYYESKVFLGFWKPGENVWTTIKTNRGPFIDITYYNGQFYVVNYYYGNRKMYVCHVGECDPTVARVVREIPCAVSAGKRLYVVELEGELVVVFRGVLWGNRRQRGEAGIYFYGNDMSRMAYRTESFAAFKVDLSNEGLKELKSLGNNALILGYNASTSVPALKYKGVRPNCIYYTDDYLMGHFGTRGRGKDIGIYNMEDRSYARIGESFSSSCPPLWVTPYF